MDGNKDTCCSHVKAWAHVKQHHLSHRSCVSDRACCFHYGECHCCGLHKFIIPVFLLMSRHLESKIVLWVYLSLIDLYFLSLGQINFWDLHLSKVFVFLNDDYKWFLLFDYEVVDVKLWFFSFLFFLFFSFFSYFLRNAHSTYSYSGALATRPLCFSVSSLYWHNRLFFTYDTSALWFFFLGPSLFLD